jgi:hypothetical protein
MASAGKTVGAMGAGAAAGSAGGPWGAAIGAGVGLLSSLLSQSAEAEQERRNAQIRALEVRKQAGENLADKQNEAFSELMQKYGSLV